MGELRASSFYAGRGPEIEAILHTPEIERNPAASPRLRDFVRVVQWNVERGEKFGGILETLRGNQDLKWADVILLNEADFGMNRSGNRHVARELARELQMHMCFGAAHFELARGTGDDQLVTGENEESLQGNAVLTRHSILDARVTALPVCFEPFHFHEKRYGRRNCLWARLGLGEGTMWVGAVHLEVRDTPGCRARQMRRLLARLPGDGGEPLLLGGDLNTNGLGRGTRLRTLASVWRLTAGSPSAVQESLRHPERGSEPLFREARAAGFEWDSLNSDEPTCGVAIDAIEDSALIPRPLRHLIRRRLGAFDHYLQFKLDWLLGRGIRGLGDGEARDRGTGVSSLAPAGVDLDFRGSNRVSDHTPIRADIRLPTRSEMR